jgi:hypothetical protein
MIILYPNGENGQGGGKYIRPCPLVTISSNSNLNNSNVDVPSSFEITLNGAILSNQSTHILQSYDPKPTFIPAGDSKELGKILTHKSELEQSFKSSDLIIEICDIDSAASKIKFKGRLTSLNFEEGIWVDICRYSASFQADYFIDSQGNIFGSNKTPSFYISQYGGMIKSFSENWSLEPEEGNGNFSDPDSNQNILRIYRLTRTVNIVGSHPHDKKAGDADSMPWENAAKYYKKYSQNNPDPWRSGIKGFFNGAIGLSETIHRGYNHLSTESIDKNEGSYTVNDSWVVSSGAAYENYNLSISKDILTSDPGSTKVTVNGTIKGLSNSAATGLIYTRGGSFEHFDNAKLLFNKVSGSGDFRANSYVFKRAQRQVQDTLNPVPVSVGLGVNEINGEITYDIAYDSRPTNFISGSLIETITINDTYPGDLFAVIPVIGRPTGPVLQYIGGRTEYQRSINIDIVMDSGYGGSIKSQLLWSKPSLLEVTRQSINDVINAISPKDEPGVRKYFLSPPQETWNPKERRYTLSLNWTYELDK